MRIDLSALPHQQQLTAGASWRRRTKFPYALRQNLRHKAASSDEPLGPILRSCFNDGDEHTSGEGARIVTQGQEYFCPRSGKICIVGIPESCLATGAKTATSQPLNKWDYPLKPDRARTEKIPSRPSRDTNGGRPHNHNLAAKPFAFSPRRETNPIQKNYRAISLKNSSFDFVFDRRVIMVSVASSIFCCTRARRKK